MAGWAAGVEGVALLCSRWVRTTHAHMRLGARRASQDHTLNLRETPSWCLKWGSLGGKSRCVQGDGSQDWLELTQLVSENRWCLGTPSTHIGCRTSERGSMNVQSMLWRACARTEL